MRLVTYRDEGSTHIGVLRDDHVIPLDNVAPDMLTLIDSGAEGLAAARAALEAGANARPLSEVQLLAPIPRPRQNIICLGMNYVAHAHESEVARAARPRCRRTRSTSPRR